MINILSSILLLAGVFFFLAGSIGLLRLPDLTLHSPELLMMLKLLLIWLAVLAASATSAHLIARQASRQETGS